MSPDPVLARERPRAPWLAAIGIGLLVALLAVATVQGRQYALLKQALPSADDDAVLLVYQAESEYLRLRDAWNRATDAARPLDPDVLRLRYERWVQRVNLLVAGRAASLIEADADSKATVQAIRSFLAEADRRFVAPGAPAVDREFLVALQPRLDALGDGVQALSLTAAHHVAESSQRRNELVRQQNRLGLGLTVFLGLLTLAFTVTALRHVREQRERRMELEQLAASLRAARREAESASEAKSVFLANISHEIRTPFHGLMGMLSLLRETGLTPRQIDYLRTATESADHLLAILNDILDMSQLESGRMTLSPGPVEVRALLRDVEALMRPQANAKHLALHIDAEPTVPERVQADATRVKQIVFNLLSNAIKFSDHGAVVLDVRAAATSDGRPVLEFAVTDTGVGMDEATVARLFRRFVQGDGSPSRRHGGTGLGLEISRTLARLMGGDITVRSKPGEGSCFTFRMPLQTLPPLAASPAPAAAEAGGARSLEVLVAEDHPVNRQYLAALLESLGHLAHFAANGQEAVAAARERRFDIVLMDLHMPVQDGIAATRAIRTLAEPSAATVPIVALTADAFPETRERCLVAGMNDFLTKPVSPAKLATCLRRLFGAAAGQGVPAEPVAPPAALPALVPARQGQVPVIDENALRAALSAVPRERLGAMIDEFLAQGPQTVQRLRTAMRDAQPLELRVNAHAAKGAALNLGLAALAATAEALQDGAAHLPAHEIARLVQRYEELLLETRQAAADIGLLPATPSARSGGAVPSAGA